MSWPSNFTAGCQLPTFTCKPSNILTSVCSNESKRLQARFAIFQAPTIWLLRKGKYYQYEGELELEKLINFALNDYD